jgi:hypothetical protein
MKMRQRLHAWQVVKHAESHVEYFLGEKKEYKKLANLISRAFISLSLKDF